MMSLHYCWTSCWYVFIRILSPPLFVTLLCMQNSLMDKCMYTCKYHVLYYVINTYVLKNVHIHVLMQFVHCQLWATLQCALPHYLPLNFIYFYVQWFVHCHCALSLVRMYIFIYNRTMTIVNKSI